MLAVVSSFEHGIEKKTFPLLFFVNVWCSMSFYTVTIKNGSNTEIVALFASQRTMPTASIWIITEQFDMCTKKTMYSWLALYCISK